MKKTLLIMILPMLLMLTGCKTTQSQSPITDFLSTVQYQQQTNETEEVVIEEELPPLTYVDMEKLKWAEQLNTEAYINKKRNQNSSSSEVIVMPDNTILYPYGLKQARLICSQNMICNIRLEELEEVLDIKGADTDRWFISNTYYGGETNFKGVVMVKPKFNNIETNVIILTDKRIYNVIVESVEEGHFTPAIGFTYPKNTSKSIVRPPVNKKAKEDNGSSTKIDLSSANTGYEIKADKGVSWTPDLVFDDGKKVFIKMNNSVENSDLPVFVVLNSKNQPELANTRYQKPYLIVDGLFTQGMLVLKEGKKENKVVIVKN